MTVLGTVNGSLGCPDCILFSTVVWLSGQHDQLRDMGRALEETGMRIYPVAWDRRQRIWNYHQIPFVVDVSHPTLLVYTCTSYAASDMTVNHH